MPLIQWGSGRQRVWIDHRSNKGKWVIIIHGGAWRDESITHESGFGVIASLDKSRIGGAASVDYRLSPEVIHPAHVEDVARGITEVCNRYHPSEILLVGHSCGAFIAGQVYPQFRSIVKGIVCVEGIHDLQLLVQEYPSYRGFVAEAFGDRESEWPTIDWRNVPVTAVVHSEKDELLSTKQALYLTNLTGAPLRLLSSGKHDEVYEKLAPTWIDLIN